MHGQILLPLDGVSLALLPVVVQFICHPVFPSASKEICVFPEMLKCIVIYTEFIHWCRL